MSKKTEAQRLADQLEAAYKNVLVGLSPSAAAELRRLDEENAAAHRVGIQQERELMRLEAANAELLEAVEALIKYDDRGANSSLELLMFLYEDAIKKARTAIAKHGSKQ